MAEHLFPCTDPDPLVDLDLRDEERLRAAHRAEYDVDGMRALLAAVNLQPASAAPVLTGSPADVTDLAVFRATGSLSLARIFASGR